MNREVHVRFSESARVKFPRATRLNTPFPDYQECMDLIFIYLPGLMISSGSPRFLKHVSDEDR
jgi:hypothetical protein